MRARLVAVQGTAEPPIVYFSPEQTVRLGRESDNTVILTDKNASRHHTEVFFADGAWQIRNRSKVNKTWLEGKSVEQDTHLRHGQIIGVSSVRFRFELLQEKNGLGDLPKLPDRQDLIVVPPAESPCNRLDTVELAALIHFMNASLYETTPYGLVSLALRIVRNQTRASVCGFLSFDTEDLQLKVVLPVEAEVDIRLSQQLTTKVRTSGCSAWLGARDDQEDIESSASLANYQDAVCVPLRRNPTGTTEQESDSGHLLGALHVYLSDKSFSEREIRFCEVLASYLANTLYALRSRRALEADNTRLRSASHGGSELLGESQVMRKLRADVANFAAGPGTVLIEGESGVGKELVALALHNQSPRHEGPLVPLNCAALSPALCDDELFGHEKGAFTSADKARPGLFRQADEGTLFLDEIGELSPEVQARFLRILETKRVRPVGSNTEITVDVRIIAATNRDLEKEMKAGRFRRDLFFRLGSRLRVPPLRDHAEDIPVLANHFLKKLNDEYRRQVQLSPEALERLMAYSWPGNVRQLRSVLETAVAMTPGGLLRPSSLRLEIGESDPQPDTLNLEEIEARAIREALKRTGGVQSRAARLLGIHRETLINKMKRYGIRSEHDQTSEDGVD